MNNPYKDIMHLSRPVSSKHLPMSMHDRAAQFSPFAALTGYDAAIEETARLTDRRAELAESSKEVLDKKIRAIQNAIDTIPEVTVTFFEPDLRKAGGAYRTVTGRVKKIDAYQKAIIFEDETSVFFHQIQNIDNSDF
jgi:hypothetical protein